MRIIKPKKRKKEIPSETKQAAPAPTATFPRVVIKRPWVSEKSQRLSVENQYVFLVDPSANKHSVKQEVQKRYDVQVVQVDMTKLKGKVKRFRNRFSTRAGLKKAVVTLKEGQKIETE